jgi:hypothetical protein
MRCPRSKQGTYTARFVTANGCRTVWSFPATLRGLSFNAPPRPAVTKPTTDTFVCIGQAMVLTAPANYPRYQWTDGSTSQTTTFRPFNSGVYSFSVRVTDVNGCVSPPSVPALLTAFYAPQSPSVTAIGNVFASSSSQGNQWFLNGMPITGANTPFFTATLRGSYTVQVKINGCASVISEPIVF